MTNGSSWCEGPFPSDLVDVALSSPADNPFEDPTTSSSSVRSPPSTDLITLDPPDHFVDADFDVVDDMKFIDSLIQVSTELSNGPEFTMKIKRKQNFNLQFDHSSLTVLKENVGLK